MITLPIAIALARNWWLLLIRGILAVFALMFGVMMIVLAFRVRGLPKRLERLSQA